MTRFSCRINPWVMALGRLHWNIGNLSESIMLSACIRYHLLLLAPVKWLPFNTQHTPDVHFRTSLLFSAKTLMENTVLYLKCISIGPRSFAFTWHYFTFEYYIMLTNNKSLGTRKQNRQYKLSKRKYRYV